MLPWNLRLASSRRWCFFWTLQLSSQGFILRSTMCTDASASRRNHIFKGEHRTNSGAGMIEVRNPAICWDILQPSLRLSGASTWNTENPGKTVVKTLWFGTALSATLKCHFTALPFRYIRKQRIGGLRCGPVVKNLPCNVGDTGLIPGWGTKTLHAAEQLSPCTSTTEPIRHKSLYPAVKEPVCCNLELMQPKQITIKTKEEEEKESHHITPVYECTMLDWHTKTQPTHLSNTEKPQIQFNTAMDWMCLPPKFIYLSHKHQCDGAWGWDLWEVIRSWGWSPHEWD